MVQEWSRLGKEVVWLFLAFGLGLAPSFMGFTPVTMGMCVILFGYVVFRLWKERC